MSNLIVRAALPPSSNNIYYTDARSGTRHLTTEALAYRQSVQWALKRAKADKSCPDPPFVVDYHFHLPNWKRRDLSNMVKLLEDSVFSWLGYDDREVYDFHAWKYIDGENPGVVMEVRHSDRNLRE